MRSTMLLAGLVAGFGWAGVASAQNSSLLGGTPQPLTYRVINTNQTNVPMASPQTLSGRTGFKLLNFIPAFRGITNQRVIGTSQYPNTNAYLQAFGYTPLSN